MRNQDLFLNETIEVGKHFLNLFCRHFRYHLYCLDPSPFTLNEDTVILEGVKMGYDLSDISLLLGKRSSMQVRNRYNAIKNKGKGLEKAWTE